MKKSKFLFLCFFAFSCISISAQKQVIDDRDNPRKDIVHADDVIIQSSECTGFDCVNGEAFGSDTKRLKENNLRIHFDDTSASASFPKNDWRITINDQTNGGAEYFGIDDATAGNRPFTISAGSGANALYVSSSGGNVGLGTASPVVELQVTDGDSPTLRLEQNGANGWTPQTWDVAGNETNFFIRDVTGGSKLPFKIRPGAPDNALYIAASGDVGIRHANPTESIHIKHADPQILVEETSTTRAGRTLLHLNNYGAPKFIMEHSEAGVDWAFQIANNGKFRLSSPGILGMEIDDTSGDVVFTGDVTANSVLLTSDLRLKKDVSPFEAGLEEVLKINPINYRFNGKAGFKNTRAFVGYAAQELQEVAPYLVQDFNVDKEDENSKVLSTETYLKIDPIAVQVLLVNAVKEQHTIIEELEDEVAELKNQMSEIIALLKDKDSKDVSLNGTSALLKQNYPNPHDGETVIEYFIPEYTSSAQIQVYDISGKLIKTVNINQKGNGQLNLAVNNFPNGQYTYSLILDGELISRKKMTLAK